MSKQLQGFQELFPTACTIGSKEQSKTLIQSLTVNICGTYKKRNPEFQYNTIDNPKRVLTKPSEPVKNNGYDNENSDYILYVHDILGPENDREKYVVFDILGSGTFGQVAKCKNLKTGEIVGVKVVKNKEAYTKQSLIEIDVLNHLNRVCGPNNETVLKLKESFMHKNHICLVFELLSVSLYQLIKHNRFRGLSINLVRVLAKQLLESMILIKSLGIVHCDLKPENILLKSLDSPAIKIIDFGSSCYESQQLYTYIQSRFYRSPEILLGIRYTTAIDMWSFGCVLSELYLGLPLFPGSSEYNQLSRIMETIGSIPDHMIIQGKHSYRFYNKRKTCFGEIKYDFKSMDQYSKERRKEEKPSKRYFPTFNLDELILKYPFPKKSMSHDEVQKEMLIRKYLLDFLRNVLEIDPSKRITPEQAIRHPFITGNYYSRYDDFVSLGKGLMKRSTKHDSDSQSDDGSDEEGSEGEGEIPAMLTGSYKMAFNKAFL